MPEPALSSKELRALRKRFKRGYTLEQTGRSNTLHVLGPQGEPVHRNGSNAPLVMHMTPLPSEWPNIERTLEAAGVLQGTKRRVKYTDEQEQARREALTQAMKTRTAQRAAEAQALYDRLAAVITPFGGLALPGMPADLAHIGLMLGNRLNNGVTYYPDRMAPNLHRVLNKGWVEPRYQEVWNEIARILEEAEDPIETFYALVRESRGLEGEQVRVRAAVEGDWPFEVALLPIEALVVDHDYQRPVPWPFVRKLAAGYDESLVGTIDVAERRKGAVFAILDGQLRFEASKLVGKSTIWASIYSGLDKASEARFFLHKNKDRKAVHPYYTFRARVVANEPGALEIEAIVQENGYKLSISAAQPGTSTENNIAGVAAVIRAYEYIRPDETESLTRTLQTLRASTLGLEHGQSSLLIRGLARLFAHYEDSELDGKHLEEVIAKTSPMILLARARDESRNSGGNAEYAMTRVLRELYNRGLSRQDKLEMRL